MSNTRGRSLKRTVAGVSAGVLTLTGAAAALAVPASAQQGFSFTRLAGADRYATAAAIATSSFATSDNVLIASGQNFPDALAGNYLAGFRSAPLLLTRTASLPTATKNALASLAAKNVTILGGTSAVSSGVEAELTAAGYTVTRVAGNDRYATAKAISETPGAGNVGTDASGAKTAILASGQTFADALTAGPLGYAKKFPVEITNPAVLSADTKAAFADLGIKNVLIAGGTAAVSAAVEAEVKALGITVTRLSGPTRQLTAVAIADYEVANAGFSRAHVNLARGDDFADALAGGPHAGKELSPILLTDTPTALGAAALKYLTDHSNTLASGHIFGGTAAVSDAVKAAAETAAKGTGVVASKAGVTTRPELVSASIFQTNASGPNMGTTIRYVFDKNVTGMAPQATLFHVYPFAGAPFDGTAAQIDATDSKAVFVRYITLTALPTGNASLSVATVDFGAVSDDTFSTRGTLADNPIGDAALTNGTATSQTTTFTAGQTSAPDLQSVGNFRVDPLNSANTLVDFTYDQAAFVANPTGFHLVLTSGVETGDIVGTFQSGSGTTTITAVFPNGGAGSLGTSNVARGYDDQGAVTATSATAVAPATPGQFPNPLQSVGVNNVNGITATPDLLSASVEKGATSIVAGAAVVDAVTYTFDQPVRVTGGSAGFIVYNQDGFEVTSGANATRSTVDNTKVRVEFPAGTFFTEPNGLVGASVRDAAVTEDIGATGRPNQEAEVGVANPNTFTSNNNTAGTAGPDLTGTALNAIKDVFGTITSYTATYAFDATVTGTPDPSKFYLVDADGTVLVATVCTTAQVANKDVNTVTCSNYVTAPLDATGTPAPSTTAATVNQVGSAVLGAVNDTAVTPSVGTASNPEGARATTGGTGTPAA